MDRDLVFQLLLRDLCACLGFTIVAGAIMLVIAVPTTFMANHPGEFRALPKRLLWNWFVGTAFTAGSWILLTAMLDLCLQWLTSGQHLLFYPFMVGYFLGWIAGIVAMWRAANSTWSFFPQGVKFSLRTLLLVQVVILAVCSLWVACRRGEIERNSRPPSEHFPQPASS